MAKRSAKLDMREGPNPYRNPSPYPDETPRSAGTDRWGQNMYDQGGQRGYQGIFPHAEGARGDSDSWAATRSNIRRSMTRGTGSGGYDGY